MFDVVSVGSATVDVFAHTDKKFVKKKEYHFPVGSKILVHKIDMATGGGGTNTAVCFARLGLKTAFIGKIGCCDNSNWILDQLKSEKIDTSLMVISKKGQAGYSMIIDAEKTDRTIFVYKGLNEEFKFKDINLKKMKTKWMYLCAFTDKSFDESKKLARWAHKQGIKIAFNPSCYISSKGYKYLKGIIDVTDILVLNEDEASDIVKGKGPQQLAKNLHELGPSIVVVTCAKKGAWAFDGECFYHTHAKNKKIVETTGAGDAFASTFVGALIKGKSVKNAMDIAQKNATSVIANVGAKNILLPWNKLAK